MQPYAGTDPLFVEELRTRGWELGSGVNVYVNGHAFKVQFSWLARMASPSALAGAEHAFYALVDATM
jgi:hypothetical protein